MPSCDFTRHVEEPIPHESSEWGWGSVFPKAELDRAGNGAHLSLPPQLSKRPSVFPTGPVLSKGPQLSLGAEFTSHPLYPSHSQSLSALSAPHPEAEVLSHFSCSPFHLQMWPFLRLRGKTATPRPQSQNPQKPGQRSLNSGSQILLFHKWGN